MSSIDRKYIEHARDAQLWKIARVTSPTQDGHIAEVMAVQSKAEELAERKAGEASNAYVEHTTDYLEGAFLVTQMGIPLGLVVEYLECVSRLEEDGVDVLPAAEAIGGVAAALGADAAPSTALLAVRASRAALR